MFFDFFKKNFFAFSEMFAVTEKQIFRRRKNFCKMSEEKKGGLIF